MILYKDILTNDELISSAYKMEEVDGIIYEVDCKLIVVKPGVDVNIGANPSAEEQEEALEDGAKQVNDIVHSFRLQPTAFDKDSYRKYLKGYMKAIKDKLKETKPDEVAEFEKKATIYVKKILANLDEYEFYIGENMNPDGMVALLNYREDGITPYFTFWKHGLKEEKL